MVLEAEAAAESRTRVCWRGIRTEFNIQRPAVWSMQHSPAHGMLGTAQRSVQQHATHSLIAKQSRVTSASSLTDHNSGPEGEPCGTPYCTFHANELIMFGCLLTYRWFLINNWIHFLSGLSPSSLGLVDLLFTPSLTSTLKSNWLAWINLLPLLDAALLAGFSLDLPSFSLSVISTLRAWALTRQHWGWSWLHSRRWVGPVDLWLGGRPHCSR